MSAKVLGRLTVANLEYVLQSISQDLQQASADTPSRTRQQEMKLLTELLHQTEEGDHSAGNGQRYSPDESFRMLKGNNQELAKP